MKVEFLTDFQYREGGDWRFELQKDASIRIKAFLGNHSYHDHEGRLWLSLDGDVVTVHEGYAWDGASPKFKLLGKWWGTPDFLTTRMASMFHDALYQFMEMDCFPLKRVECDSLFGEIMKSKQSNVWWIFSNTVKVLGGIHNALFRSKTKGYCTV